jgi:PBSX family phage terminase large subunit
VIFKPTLKQNICWQYLNDKTTKQIFYGGSGGCGKTYLGCMWIILSCLQYPSTRYLIARSKLINLKRTTLKTFFEIIHENQLKDHIKFNAQNNQFTFSNGSEVLLMDLFPYPTDPDYDKLGSLEITGAFIDELSDIEFKAYETILSRIRFKLKEYNLIPKLFSASNPTKGWPYSYFYQPFVNNCERNDIKFTQALPTDNPYISTDYLETLQSLQPKIKSRLYDGNWEFTEEENELIQYEKLLQCFYNESTLSGDTTMYLTADIADLGNDRTVLCIWHGWTLIKYDIYLKKDTKFIVESIKELMKLYKIQISNVIIDATGVGAGVCSYLPGSIRYNSSEKALNDEKYYNLKTQLWFKFTGKINNQEVSFQFPYDEKLVQELSAYKKEVKNEKIKVTSKDDVKRQLGRSPDIADAAYLRAYFDYKKKGIVNWKVF